MNYEISSSPCENKNASSESSVPKVFDPTNLHKPIKSNPSRPADDFRNIHDFNFACKLIHECRHLELLRLPRPPPQILCMHTRQQKYVIDRLRLIPLLLQHRRYRSEVTAIFCQFELTSKPLSVSIVFAKNKALTNSDIQRADEAVELIKQYVPGSRAEFFTAIMKYVSKYSFAKIARVFRNTLVSYRDVTILLAKTLDPGKAPPSWAQSTYNGPGDEFLREVGNMDGVAPAISLLSILILIVNIANRNQHKVDARDLSSICTFAFHLRLSTLFQRALDDIEDRYLKEQSNKLMASFEVLGDYFFASRELWEMFQHDPYKSAVSSLIITPFEDLKANEVREISKSLGLNVITPLDEADNNFEEFFQIIQRRAEWLGKTAGSAEEWLEAFPALRSLTGKTSLSGDSLPAEIKLVFHLLRAGYRGHLDIGMSEPPSVMSEYWITSFNEIFPHQFVNVHIPTASKRVGCYPWTIPGVASVDTLMNQKVLKHIEAIIGHFCKEPVKQEVSSLFSK